MARTTKFILEVDSKGMRRELSKVEDSAHGVDDALDSTKKQTNLMSGAWRKFGQVVAGLAVGELIRRGLTRAIRKGKEFEQQLADLSAITGIQGDSLDELGDQALEVSKEFGESASNIVEAQKLVASQLAEKIDFGTEQGLQQLKEITRESIVLQKAAGVDLATAVQASTTAINQFNLEASEAPRITNTMAAAAKFGAAEVGDQARALVDAGVAASSANVSFEETSAAIQILAQNGIRGQRAGTGLRNIFTILTAESEKLEEQGLKPVNFQQQSLAEGLAQLRPLLKDESALLQIFGRENINSAKALIQNAEATGEFTEKITGTNTAAEQAKVQLNTFEGASSRLASTFDAELIKAFQESNGLMVTLINSTASLVEQFAGGIRVINGWVEGHQELRREMGNAEAQARAIIKTSQNGIETTKEQIKQQNLQGEALKQANEFIESQRQRIEDVNQQFAAYEESLKQQIEQQKAIQEEQGKTNYEWAMAQKRIEKLEIRLKTAQNVQQDYVQLTKDTTAARREDTEATQQQTEEQSTLNSEISDAEKKMKSLANKQVGEFSEADQQEINRLQTKIDKLQALREERLKEAQTISEINRIQREQDETEILGGRQGVDSMTLGTGFGQQEGTEKSKEERQKEREAQLVDSLKNKTVQLTEAERQRAAAATSGAKQSKDAKQGELTMTEQLGLAAAEAAAGSIARGETVGETIRNVLKALLAEVVALQVRNVLSTVPFPLNVAIAGAAAAGAKALFDSVVPEFQEGGVVTGAIGDSGLTTRGKKMISINEDGRPEFVVNAESTRRALPLLQAINDSPALAGIIGQQIGFQQGGQVTGQSGINMAALGDTIVNALRKAPLVARVELADFNDELREFQQFQNRIGNNA